MTRNHGFIRWEPVDHTADLAYIVRGRSLEELLENAARGMMAFLIEPDLVDPSQEEVIEAEGHEPEDRLVAWLQEILYRLEVGGRIYRDFHVASAGPDRVRATAWGEAFDPDRHRLQADIKAATYHDLRIGRERQDSGIEIFRARIVLDI